MAATDADEAGVAETRIPLGARMQSHHSTADTDKVASAVAAPLSRVLALVVWDLQADYRCRPGHSSPRRAALAAHTESAA